MSTIKANRWAWILAGTALAGGGLVLAFLLVMATQNCERREPYFRWLVWGNLAVAAVLGLTIAIALGRLALRLRARKFGSRLLLKLAGIFGLVVLLPGLLIYTVSYQFVSRSIETWFDVRVEGALEAGLNLGRSTLDTLAQDVAAKNRTAPLRLAEEPRTSAQPGLLELERLREQLGARTVSVASESGLVAMTAGGNSTRLLTTERLPITWRSDARNRGVYAQIEGLEDQADATGPPRIIAVAWMPDRSFSLQSSGHYLVVTQLIPSELVRNALDVQSAYQEYQQRALGRGGLRKMYIGTLTLALVLAVFGAFLLAAILGQQLARPLLLLAEGVQEVARGDLRPKTIFASRDELGGLTRAFAAMTQQLADARNLAERSVQELESARAHLQTVLDNLSAGVIVFDAQGRIDMVNPGATRILKLPISAYRGRPLADVNGPQDFAAAIRQRFELYANDPTPGERQQWQESYELSLPHSPDPLTLLVRGAELPAERLEIKLADKLDDPGRQLLTRSVNTIVTQVQALKSLINEFRDYARLPSAKLVPLNLNELISEVMALYGQALEQGTLSLDLAPDLPAIQGDAALLRQVVHNLVQNALDAAHDRTAEHGPAHVIVRTDTPRNEDGSIRAVRLAVRDNGPGFPDKVLRRAFEPYLTTKAKGTGLGLAVVKKIADEHKALARIRNLTANPSQPPIETGAQGNSPGAPRSAGAQVSLSFSVLSSIPHQSGSH